MYRETLYYQKPRTTFYEARLASYEMNFDVRPRRKGRASARAARIMFTAFAI